MIPCLIVIDAWSDFAVIGIAVSTEGHPRLTPDRGDPSPLSDKCWKGRLRVALLLFGASDYARASRWQEGQRPDSSTV